MIPGTQYYEEGKFDPEWVDYGFFNVWCCTGAIKILGDREYVHFLMDKPKGIFRINFANGSAARIYQTHPLWKLMTQIMAEGFCIEVLKLIPINSEYAKWDGKNDCPKEFDSIQITKD